MMYTLYTTGKIIESIPKLPALDSIFYYSKGLFVLKSLGSLL